MKSKLTATRIALGIMTFLALLFLFMLFAQQYQIDKQLEAWPEPCTTKIQLQLVY